MPVTSQQNLYLAGTAAGLGVCAVGAFFDDLVNGLIEVDGVEETTVYLAAVGWPKTAEALEYIFHHVCCNLCYNRSSKKKGGL